MSVFSLDTKLIDVINVEIENAAAGGQALEDAVGRCGLRRLLGRCGLRRLLRRCGPRRRLERTHRVRMVAVRVGPDKRSGRRRRGLDVGLPALVVAEGLGCRMVGRRAIGTWQGLLAFGATRAIESHVPLPKHPTPDGWGQ